MIIDHAKKQHKFDHGDSNDANYGDTTDAANLMKLVMLKPMPWEISKRVLKVKGEQQLEQSRSCIYSFK